jgi:hypothetical protein
MQKGHYASPWVLAGFLGHSGELWVMSEPSNGKLQILRVRVALEKPLSH